jgi:prepilin-type N-terminal cleavage/methylation domain-containing protein
MQKRIHRCANSALSVPAGFTLLELLAVLLMVSVLAAIAAPGWVTFLEKQRLTTAQAQVAEAIQMTQKRAQLSHRRWAFNVREANGVVQWSIQAADQSPTSAQWNSLDASIRLDQETSLPQKEGVHRVQFDNHGHVNGQFGTLTLTSHTNPRLKRCVIVATLLGAIRTAQENPVAQNGDFCY